MASKTFRSRLAGRAFILPLAMCATAAGAATCYGRTQGDAAAIYCSGEGADVEDCTFVWQLTAEDGSDVPWRGTFRVQYSEENSLKMRQGPVTGAASNLSYTCVVAPTVLGATGIGDVSEDPADHFLEGHEAVQRRRSTNVAKVTSERLRQPCRRPVRDARSALDANHIKGYDEDNAKACPPGV